MTHQNTLENWFRNTLLGQHLLAQEQDFFQAALVGRQPENILLLDFPSILIDLSGKSKIIRQAVRPPADVLADTMALPWAEHSFDCVIAAHLSENCNNSTVFAKSLFPILKPQGCLILTGFNPISLWRLRRRDMPDGLRNALPLPKLKNLLAETGWHIDEGRFINYLPPVQSSEAIRFWQFMEAAGNRWWPHGAAVYGLVLTRRLIPLNPLTEAALLPAFEGAHVLGLTREGG